MKFLDRAGSPFVFCDSPAGLFQDLADADLVPQSRKLSSKPGKEVAQHALEQRTVELGRFNRLAFGRELRMIELKQLVNDRSVQLGMPAPFDLSFADGFEDVRTSGGESS